MNRAPASPSLLLMLVMALLTLPSHAKAQDLVADLSEHLVAITTGFTGTDVLLFGAIEGQGDVVVVVTGPAQDVIVRRKDKVLGVWLNAKSLRFSGVPSYYAVASSRPVNTFLNDALQARLEVGAQHLRISPVEGQRATEREMIDFRQALIRRKQVRGLFQDEIGEVSFIGRTLFRTRLFLPANVPTGTYIITAYLIRDNDVASAQTTPLLISKIGIGADVYDFAYEQSAAYGLIAVIIAVMAGWLASVIFRKS
ncbi:TIGR02186 family protein [Oceanibaculum pacificum]|nr:TIGR02186 family protein [Oceanibaculum pacificum]